MIESPVTRTRSRSAERHQIRVRPEELLTIDLQDYRVAICGGSVDRLPCEYKPVNLAAGEQFIPEFKCLNHLHFVPVLVDGDTVVSDSFAILLYLGDKYPQRLLLPADPRLKALKLQAASIISSSMQPLHLPSVLKYLTEKFGPEESQSWAQSNIEKGFFALEALLKDFDSRYATGDVVYMVSNLNTQ